MTAPAYRPKMGTYSRLSVAADISNTSLDGQDSTLDAVADREGFDITMRREDNGKSGGKERANAVELLDALRDGTIDVLGVASFDRWTRMGIADAAKIIEVVTARNAAAKRGRGRPALFIAEREGIRSDVEGWELRLAFAADLARMERERIAARQVASHARLRVAGRFPGGLIPFGYRSAPREGGGRTLVVSRFEADVVRSLVRDALAGVSTIELAARLTADGVATPRSPWRRALLVDGAIPDPARDLARGTWPGVTVRQLLRSPHLLGVLSHDGRQVIGEDGKPVAPFPPIIDAATRQRLLSRFPSGSKGQPRRRWSRLLSGFAYCAACGGKLYPEQRAGAYVRYRCQAKAVGRSCPTSDQSISAEGLERHVVDLLLSRFGHLPELERVEALSTSDVQLAAVRASIDEAARALTDRSADRAALLAQLDQLQAEEAALEALPTTTRVQWRRTGRTVAEAWEATEALHARRVILETWLDHVAVRGAGRPSGPKLDTSRIAVEWRPGVEETLADLVG